VVRTSLLSRALYWLGVAVTLAAVGLVLYAARAPSLPLIGVGFALGLVGLAITARGATMAR